MYIRSIQIQTVILKNKRMKVIMYVALYERQELAGRVVNGWNALVEVGKKHGITLDFHFIYTNKDDLKAFTDDLKADLTCNYSENRPLGRKLNSGLQDVIYKEYNYFMQCGTDDIISPVFWQRAEPFLLEYREGIGCKNLIIENFKTGQKKYGKFTEVFGAARMIRMDLIRDAVECYDCISTVSNTSGLRRGEAAILPRRKKILAIAKDCKEVLQLWDEDRNSGLDWNSECNLMKRAHVFRIDAVDGDDFLVTDLKTDDNIHGWEKF